MENNNINSKIKFSIDIGFLSMAVALIIGALIIGQAIINFKEIGFALSVTGSAKKTVTSDQVIWSLQTSRMTQLANVKEAYKQIEADRKIVIDFLKAQGVSEDTIKIQPATMEQQWDGPQVSNPQEKIYSVRQIITITSGEVNKITEIANNVQPIVDKGVLLSNFGLQYNYTKLADERVAMLAEAMRDARARAQAIAASDGRKVGQFIDAASGVVQVLAKDSVDVSDYGSLDTSSIEKDIMVTVKTSFRIK